MAQLIRITSEALQAQIRRLLPSQQGFGEDLNATNVITPIIDLTPTAEGSSVPQYLQTALAFGSQSTFSANNATQTLANSPGFWRVTGVSSLEQSGTTVQSNKISLSDGLSTKDVWQHFLNSGSGDSASALQFDYTVFLDVGESISVTSSSTGVTIAGTYRQVATSNGTLVNPSGFTPQ